MTESISADYLIMGAGAAGMAFADSVFTQTDATMVIVDRHDRPGGHWNDVYPFVRLHQPSSVLRRQLQPISEPAASMRSGSNAGYLRAGGRSRGRQPLRRRDAASVLAVGPGAILPDERGRRRRRRSRRCCRERAPGRRSTVRRRDPLEDAGAVDGPRRAIRSAPDVACVPLNELPRVAGDYDEFVVIGAGKTGMDACIWLLGNGADPDRIRWIVPRDSWVLTGRNVQPGDEFFAAFCKSLADQVECGRARRLRRRCLRAARGRGRAAQDRPDVTPDGLPLRDLERR